MENAQSRPELEAPPTPCAEAKTIPLSQHVNPPQLPNLQTVAESTFTHTHSLAESQQFVKLLSHYLELLHHKTEVSEMKCAKTNQTLAIMEEENEILKTEKQEMRIENGSLQTQCGNLKEDNESLKAEIDTLKRIIDNLNQEYCNWRTELGECAIKISTLEAKLAVSIQDRDENLLEIEALRTELHDGRPTPDEWEKMQQGLEYMYGKLGNFSQALYRRDQGITALQEQLRKTEKQLEAETDRGKKLQDWKVKIESALSGTLRMLSDSIDGAQGTAMAEG